MTEVTVSYSLISEEASCHFCCVLFKSKSLEPAQTQEEKVTQGQEYQGGEDHWDLMVTSLKGFKR